MINEELYTLCKKFTNDDNNHSTSSNAVYNALQRGGITTVEELKNTPLDEIKDIRSVGEKKLEIIAKMKGEEIKKSVIQENPLVKGKEKIRIIFWVRPLKFLFLSNYWGVRKGNKWAYAPEKHSFMIDLGLITIGYAI